MDFEVILRPKSRSKAFPATYTEGEEKDRSDPGRARIGANVVSQTAALLGLNRAPAIITTM